MLISSILIFRHQEVHLLGSWIVNSLLQLFLHLSHLGLQLVIFFKSQFQLLLKLSPFIFDGCLLLLMLLPLPLTFTIFTVYLRFQHLHSPLKRIKLLILGINVILQILFLTLHSLILGLKLVDRRIVIRSHLVQFILLCLQ